MKFHDALSPAEINKYCNCRGRWSQSTAREKSMRLLCLSIIFAVAFVVSLTSLARTGEANNSNTRGAAELYSKHCASCHGRDGRAKTLKAKLNHARDLTDSVWQDRTSDERLFNAIMNGKRKMPAFSKKLSEQEIDDLVSYIRVLKK